MTTEQSSQQDQPLIVLTPTTNCSAIVAELILDHFEIPKMEQSLHLLHGMGHGLGMGSACGGLTGAIFAINHLLNLQGANKQEINDALQEFKQEFAKRFQEVNCSDILDLHFDSNEYKTRQTRFCGNLLDDSTNEAVEIVNLVCSLINPISYSMNKH